MSVSTSAVPLTITTCCASAGARAVGLGVAVARVRKRLVRHRAFYLPKRDNSRIGQGGALKAHKHF